MQTILSLSTAFIAGSTCLPDRSLLNVERNELLEVDNAIDDRRNNSRLAHLRRRNRRAANHSRRSGLKDARHQPVVVSMIAQRQPAEAHTDRVVLSARGHIGGWSCRYPVRTHTRDRRAL